MKKIICIFMTFFMIVGLVFPVFGAESTAIKRERAISFLLNAGWTEEDIYDLLSDEALLEFADAKAVVASEKKYYKVTEEENIEISETECMEAVNTINAMTNCTVSVCSGGDTYIDDVTTSDGYLTYYVELYDFGNGDYMLSGRFEWLISPTNRREDVFGVGHDGYLTQYSDYPVYYIYKYEYTIGGSSPVTHEITTPTGINIDTYGTVIKQDLQNDSTAMNIVEQAVNHRGYLQYKVFVNNTSAIGFSVNAQYFHQQGVWSVSPSISYPEALSVGISYSTFFKQMSPNPYLSIKFE